MPHLIAEYLETLKIADPVTHGRLAMYPLLTEHDRAPDYLTLDQALADGLCEVRELTDAGHVNRLVLVNHADRPILLLDGDLLIGARQNRVLNLTLLAPAQAKTQLPVSCVEQGRWSYASERRFRAADRACSVRTRAIKAASVTEQKRRHHRSDADQYAVWQEIRAKSARMAVHSQTENLDELYDPWTKALADQVHAFSPQPQQVGAVFTLDGRILGLDLFDCPSTLARVLPRLVQGYGLEAFDPIHAAEAAQDPAVEAFLSRLKAAQPSLHPAAGLGQDGRIDNADLGASALLHEGRVMHLFAYVP